MELESKITELESAALSLAKKREAELAAERAVAEERKANAAAAKFTEIILVKVLGVVLAKIVKHVRLGLVAVVILSGFALAWASAWAHMSV